MVHPKNLVTSSCSLCLKFEIRQKATLKWTCKKTIALQCALRITQDRAHNKFKKLSLMTFLLLHITNQLSKPRNDILFNCYPHQWIDVCDWISFARFDLTQTRKTLSHKYVVGIWVITEVAFLLCFCILAHLVGAPKIQYIVFLYIMLLCRNLIDDEINLQFQ